MFIDFHLNQFILVDQYSFEDTSISHQSSNPRNMPEFSTLATSQLIS